MKTLCIVLVLFLSGCAGTPTADRAAKFAHEYCDLSLLSRSALRTQANAILEVYATKENPPAEPDYVCFDCGDVAGDECKDRSPPKPAQ